MKKILFFVVASIGVVGAGHCTMPVGIVAGLPESAYVVTHSTVAVSSQTVSTDSAVGGFRAVYLLNLSATNTVYYYLGTAASTTTITGTGWPILPVKPNLNAIPEVIEYNGLINYRLAPGATASTDLIKKVIQK